MQRQRGKALKISDFNKFWGEQKVASADVQQYKILLSALQIWKLLTWNNWKQKGYSKMLPGGCQTAWQEYWTCGVTLNLSEHPLERVTLGQLLVCGDTRLADGWETPSSSPLSAFSPVPPFTIRTGGCLLCLQRGSGLEISCCCFHMNERRKEGWCPETVVCLHLLELLINTAVIITHTREIWDSTVLTYSGRRVDVVLSETLCVCTL